MLLSSPSIFEYRTTPLMAWKKKAISFLSRKAVVTLLDVLAIISAVGLLVAGVIRLGCHQCPGPYITYAKEQP